MQRTKFKQSKSDEKGAALVMAVLISFLLLTASAGLLLEASINTGNITDATSEQQAYNAAESGIQSAVYVLRDNVRLADADRLDMTRPASDPANRISFVRALRLTTSNLAADPSSTPRLSRWLSYNGLYNDRVTIGTGGYVPSNGYAYSLELSDPDHTSTAVRFSTNGRMFDNDCPQPAGCASNTDPLRYQKTYSNGAGNTFTVRYTPKSATNLDTSSGSANTDFGTFTVSSTGTGAPISAFNRFEIIVTMTTPYDAVRTIRGYVETCNPCSVGGTLPRIIFDAQSYTLSGSSLDLAFGWGSPTNQTIIGPPQRYGYEAQMSSGANVVTGTLTSPEPRRILVKSTGFGPRGAKKQLEAIVQKDFFNGLTAPATLTLVGPPSTTACPGCTPAVPTSNFTFNPGSSNVTVYTGVDAVSTDIIPPIGTTGQTNLDVVEDSVAGQPPHPFNGTVIGTPSDITEEIPTWLSSPSQLDTAIRSLYNVANSSGRYFPSGQQPTTFGNNLTGQGITFCDGNCTFTGDGGGVLVVTGKLTLHGNFNFNGLIIVTGPAGVDRSGGGNGTIQGNIVVAPYVNSGVLPVSNPVSPTFLSPQYDLSGGGNSTVQYNSASVAGGLVAVSNFVLGVAEK
jgi:hypothetical protein